MTCARSMSPWRTDQWMLIVGVAIVSAVSLAAHLQAGRSNEVHPDELDWSTRAYFFRLAFLDGNMSHQLWADYDGIDQPHVNDVLIGAALHMLGHPVPEVPTGSISWAGRPLPSGPRLWAARMPAVLLGAAVAPMLALLGTMVTRRPGFGALAGFLYLAHPLTLPCQARAMSDAPLQFFSTLAILILAWAYPRLTNPDDPRPLFRGRPLALLVAGPIALGLATGAKLTGTFVTAAALAAVFLATGHRLRSGRVPAPPRIGYALAFVLATALWTVAFNPTLYPDPAGRLATMLEHRWDLSRRQAVTMPEDALPGLGARFGACYMRTFGGGIAPGTHAVFLGLAVAGAAAASAGVVRRARRSLSPAVPVLLWALVLVVGLAPSLPLDWDRYYLPFVPPALLLAVAGVSLFADAALVPASRFRWVGLSLAAAVWTHVAARLWHVPGPLAWIGVNYAALRAAVPAMGRLDLSTAAALPCPPALLPFVAPFASITPIPGLLAWSAVNLALLIAVVSVVARLAAGRPPGTLMLAALLSFPVGYGTLVGEPIVLLVSGVGLTSWALRRGHDAAAGIACVLLCGAPVIAAAFGLVFLINGRWRALAGWALGASAALVASAAVAGTSPSRLLIAQLRVAFLPPAAGMSPYADQTISWHGLLLNVLPPGRETAIATLVLALSAGTFALLPVVWRGAWAPHSPRFVARLLATLVLALLTGAGHHPQVASALLAPTLALLACNQTPLDPFIPACRRLVCLGAFGPLVVLYLGGSMRHASLVLIAALLASIPALLTAAACGGRVVTEPSAPGRHGGIAMQADGTAPTRDRAAEQDR